MSSPLSRNMRDGQILIKDGASASITLDTDEGDFNIEWGSEPRVIKQRGALGHLRAGDEVPLKWSFKVKVSKLRADESTLGGTDSVPTVIDAFEKKGPAAAWTTTGASGEPHQVKLVFKIANPVSAGRREVITLDKSRASSWKFAEGDEYDTLEASGISMITEPAITFEAQT